MREVRFYACHDDGCVAYLNGKLIYDYNGVKTNSIILDETTRSYLTEGDNVLAIRVRDGGGSAYLDCGIYAYSLINSTFDNNNGWSGSYDRYSYDSNTIGYRYGKTFRCEQIIEGAAAGLYRLTANACGIEYYNDYNSAFAHQNDELPAKIFIGKDEKAIPSAFSETADVDYGYCWNVNGKYVPYCVDRTPWAFKRGMYQCELWSMYQPEEDGNLTVGIYSNADNDVSRWAAWDNLDVTYYTESDVTVMLDSISNVFTDLINKVQNAEVKKRATSLVNDAKIAESYEQKAKAFASMMQYEPTVRKSIKAYEDLSATLIVLTTKLSEANTFTSPATINEATQLAEEVQNAYGNGIYDNSEVADAISRIEIMVTRLGYTYLDVAVTVPGSLGDTILSKVENFVDVKSIKLSGTLDDADLSTIQSRLSQLREIDMTNVKMTSLPNRFFYQHSLLESVKLPVNLTSIGEYAFYQCYGIKHIDFPATTTIINRYAFSECDNLQEVILPEGLMNIGEYAFYSCDNNKHVKLPSSLKSISSYAFYYNLNLKTVDFAEGLTHIYDRAFHDCYALNNLKFPTTLYYIGGGAFAYNHALSNVEFNEGLFQIGDNAFYDCDALTEVTLPSSLILANASPFDYCDNLVKVTCLSIEPPYMTDQIPLGVNMEGRELYVPALSVNVYKQTTGWDKFPTIKPIDYQPENIAVRTDLHLTLQENIPDNYKPIVELLYHQDNPFYYGSLTVNGPGTLSMSSFFMNWSPNNQYVAYNRNINYNSLINNSHLRSDEVTILFSTRNNIWSFISVPFDVKISDIVNTYDGTTNWVIRKYDGQKRASGETSDTWVKMSGDDILNAGEGYIIQGSRYIGNEWQQYSGFQMKAINNANKNNLFRTDDITVTLNEYQSEFAHNRSWNLIGNPYPCYYDTRFMDFEAPITVWNMRNSTYEAYSPLDDSYILCPGEAFFVQRPVDREDIKFHKDGRQTNRDARSIEAPSYERRNKAKADMQHRIIVNLNLSDGNYTDRARIVLNENASLQYEMEKDASKFMSTDASVPQIYTSMNGINYAINERPFVDGSVNLSTYFGAEGFYTITLTNEVQDYNVILEDKAENKSFLLTEGNGYTFSAKAGTYANRFVVHFDNVSTGIEDARHNEGNETSIYSIDGIKIDAPTKKGVYIQNGKKIMLNK